MAWRSPPEARGSDRHRSRLFPPGPAFHSRVFLLPLPLLIILSFVLTPPAVATADSESLFSMLKKRGMIAILQKKRPIEMWADEGIAGAQLFYERSYSYDDLYGEALDAITDIRRKYESKGYPVPAQDYFRRNSLLQMASSGREGKIFHRMYAGLTTDDKRWLFPASQKWVLIRQDPDGNRQIWPFEAIWFVRYEQEHDDRFTSREVPLGLYKDVVIKPFPQAVRPEDSGSFDARLDDQPCMSRNYPYQNWVRRRIVDPDSDGNIIEDDVNRPRPDLYVVTLLGLTAGRSREGEKWKDVKRDRETLTILTYDPGEESLDRVVNDFLNGERIVLTLTNPGGTR